MDEFRHISTDVLPLIRVENWFLCSILAFLYPAILKSVVCYTLHSKIVFERPSVSLFVCQRIVFTLCWEHFLTKFL